MHVSVYAAFQVVLTLADPAERLCASLIINQTSHVKYEHDVATASTTISARMQTLPSKSSVISQTEGFS